MAGDRMKPQSLPKRMIIKSKKEMAHVFKTAPLKQGELLTLYHLKKPKTGTRFAFVCDRGIKKATERNRLKRIMREIFRAEKNKFLNQETIFLARQTAVGKTFWQIKEDFVRLMSPGQN